MKIITSIRIKNYLTFGYFFMSFFGFSQNVTSPQVLFSQRTSAATPFQTIYNVKGDFTLIGNTNLSLATYSDATDNQNNEMRFVDIDGDSNTLNSSKAMLELSNLGENSANQNCSTVLFAGLYWTGKSDDANETFTANRRISNGQTALSSNYTLTVSRAGSSSNYYPVYTFATITGTPHTYAFSFTNATSGSSIVTLRIDNGSASNVPVTYNSLGIATLTTPYTSNAAWGTQFILTGFTRSTLKNLSLLDYQSSSSAGIVISSSKTFDKKSISFKGPGASGYTTITTSSTVRFPGTSHSGIFVGYQEVTDYVKTHGPGAYTVADIALMEGNNGNQNYTQNPGYSGGWGLVVIYENPVMKSRAVTLFDGYAYVNGQRAGGGEYGNIDISGFTTVGTGPVNMKLGVMAAEGDRNLNGDYLAVQKLTADPNKAYNNTNYWAFNTAGLGNTTITQNFFNSSITGGNRTPNLVNNTGVDFSMFTIPNTGNSVIGNNQTSTTFRFGSTIDVFTIFGFAMSVDAYIPEPKGLISVNSINNITNPTILNALPGQVINYSLDITNEGTEATNNTLITIPIPATAIFNTGTITSNLYNGATQVSAPVYNSGTNTITWNLGTLPITAGHPEYVYANLSFTLDVTTDCSVILNAGCSPEVSLENGTITGTGAISGSPFTKYFFQGYDETSCNLPISGSIKVAIDTASCLSAMAGPDQIASCGGEFVTLAATEAIGTWTIVNPVGGEIFSDNTSPTSTFYSPNLGAYTLRWTTSCATTDDVLITFENCDVINFDGTDDHINFKNEFNLNSGSFSVEVWIKSNATNSNTQTIISKRFNTSSTDGYDLRLVNNMLSFNWNNGNAITSTYPIDINRWYHIAVTFSGSNYNLYVDGILVSGPISGANPTSNGVNFIVGAMDQNNITPFHYFNGWMDELRIWNTALTVDQIRQMMNQEIKNDGSGNVKGAIVPKNISGLTWSNLNGYYQMNGATDINNGYLVDKANTPINGKLKNIYTPQLETAPLPYTSGANGAWETDATWTHHNVWDVPNSLGIDSSTKIDWNIVKTAHNISSNGNKTVLGLLVTINTLSSNNDSKIEVSSYLKLDGKIDLVGKSQLLQTTNSDVDPTSSGSIERDQQGQVNKYNYNYWCSPVSPINTITNNTDYTVAAMLKDGTTSTPQNINWIAGYDGVATSPISIARYWLYTFDNYVNAYANWKKIVETTPIRVGQGFTMKGSDIPPPSPSRIAQKTTNKVSLTETTQNYTFVGKPNNGLINSNTVLPDYLLLTGNPYPSALDAKKFIEDNIDSIDGTLYFWEHYSTNNTHVLKDYQGGYATLNLVGGVAVGSAPSSLDLEISGLGTGNKGIPNRFIPVGQGFFVNGKIGSGGPIIFNNNQRAFVKETDAINSNSLFKQRPSASKPAIIDHLNNNANDIAPKDIYKKVRLGFNSSNNYHRQLLLGFMNEKATSKMDNGYDAINLDDIPNDMYFLNDGNQLVIQGEGYFDENASYPIGVKTAVEGKVSFTIDALENFNTEQPIFIYDNLTDTYHNIRSTKYEVNLPIGTNDKRFSLRFKDKTLKVDQHAISEAIQILYIQNENSLEIKNKSIDLTVEKVTLYNILGQSISTWKIENQDQQNITIPIKTVSSGIYIAKLKTFNGEISKKVIVFDD